MVDGSDSHLVLYSTKSYFFWQRHELVGRGVLNGDPERVLLEGNLVVVAALEVRKLLYQKQREVTDGGGALHLQIFLVQLVKGSFVRMRRKHEVDPLRFGRRLLGDFAGLLKVFFLSDMIVVRVGERFIRGWLGRSSSFVVGWLRRKCRFFT